MIHRESPGVSEQEQRFLVELGSRVRDVRGLRGWTQADLADAAGVYRSTVARVEGAATAATVLTCKRLAAALGVSLPWLLTGPPTTGR